MYMYMHSMFFETIVIQLYIGMHTYLYKQIELEFGNIQVYRYVLERYMQVYRYVLESSE